MKIRAKISILALTLIAVVVGCITANLILLERRKVREEFSGRIDALMEGVLRIARESLSTQDELMLLSYLKFLMKDYPEIELAIVSRQGHTSLLGEVRTPLMYRNLTITDWRAAKFRANAAKAAPAELGKAAPPPKAGAVDSIPPSTFTIQLGFSKGVLEAKVRSAQADLAAKILAIAGIGLLLGLAGSLWLGRLLARPVSELSAAAQAIGEGKLDTVVMARGRDEIASLALQFNLMAGRLRDLMQLKEDLLDTLTHELNTPLSGLKGFLEFLSESAQAQDPALRQESYQTMSQAVRQMEISLTNAIELFKSDKGPAIQREEVRILRILEEVVRLFTPMAHFSQISIQGPYAPASLAVAADKELLRRVFVNLVSNGLKYTPPGGTVTITASEDEAHALVRVSDSGPGIAPEDRERIFTKFYRAPGADGRPQRIPGSGLGLAIAKQAVELQSGRIWVESTKGKGSTFHVEIPKRARGSDEKA